MTTRFFNFFLLLLVFEARKGWSASESDAPPAIREEIRTTELSLGENEYFSKRTGDDGDSLIIGSHYLPYNFRGADDDDHETLVSKDYTCDLIRDGSLKSDKFNPEIYKRQVRSPTVTAEEKKDKTDVSNYFIHLSNQIWKCKDKQNSGPVFVFIRNEMMSITEIYEIKFKLGVNISFINYPYQEGRRVKVTETKYFILNTGNQLQQVSKMLMEDFTLVRESGVSDDIPNRGTVQVIVTEKDAPLYDVKVHAISTEDVGETLKIGSLWRKRTILAEDQEKEIECTPLLGVNPAIFRPEIFRVHNLGESPTNNIYPKMSGDEFKERFIIIRREVSTCYFAEPREEIELGFYRVEHEVIGTKAIAKVLVEYGIKSMKSITLSNTGNEKTVRYTEVEYFFHHNWKLMPYVVKTKVIPLQIFHSYVAPELNIETSFFLIGRHQQLVFRTFIGDVGYNLRVGSVKLSLYKYLPNPKLIVSCEKTEEYFEEYNTIFKIIMNGDGKLIRTRDVEEEENEYYKYLSREAWQCYIKTDNNIAAPKNVFTRIRNKLKVLVPVYELETYDGVEIAYDGTDKSLELTEIKYYSHEMKHYIIFDDVLNLNEPSSDHSNTPLTNIISKTKDDIVSWTAHYPDTFFNLRDWNNKDLGTINELIGTSSKSMEFTYTATENQIVENARTNIYLCKEEKNFADKPVATFKILDKSQTETANINFMDHNGNLEYFENVETEVQWCEEMKDEETELTSRNEPSMRVKYV